MTSIVIVSGCPGSGKTTVSRALAGRSPEAVHLLSDLFYEFPAVPIEPTLAESHHQNTVIMRAVALAARAFAEGGYRVFLDGVVGPWFLPVLREELAGGPRVSYVVLRADASLALQRVRERQGPGASAGVRQMVSAFADLGAFEGHAVDTARLSVEEVAALVRRGLERGRFRLDW